MARDMCLPSSALSITIWVMSMLPLPFALGIIFYGLKQSRNLKWRCLKNVYICALCSICIAQTIWPVHLYFDHLFSGICTNFTRVYVTSTIANASYCGSLIIIDIIYTLRLFIFKGTIYRSVKIQTMVISVVFVIEIFALFALLYSSRLYWVSFWNNDPTGTVNYLYYLLIFSILFMTSHLTNNILLLILFVRNMHRICTNAKHVIQSPYAEEIPDDISKVIQIATRYMLCLLLSFMTTTVAASMMFIRGNVVQDSNTVYITNATVNTWDVFFNLVSIILQLDSHHINIVFDHLCKCCKQGLQKCWINKLLQTAGYNEDEDTVTSSRSGKASATGNTVETTKKSSIKALPEITEMTQLKETNNTVSL